MSKTKQKSVFLQSIVDIIPKLITSCQHIYQVLLSGHHHHQKLPRGSRMILHFINYFA